MSDKNIMNLIISKGMSSLSGVFSSFMLNLWLFDKTNSYTIFILNTTATSLVPLLMSIPAGFIADRFNKARILMMTDLSIAFLFFLLICITALDIFNLMLYISIIFLIAIANEFRYTAMTAIIPELVGKQELMKYNGIQQVFRGASIIVAPIIGALSYEFIRIYYALSFSILVQFYSLFILNKIANTVKLTSKENKTVIGIDYKKIFRWIWNDRLLRIYLISFTFISALLASYTAIITPYILEVFDKKTLVFVTICQGFGLLLSGFLSVKLKKFDENSIYQYSVTLIGSSIFCIGFVKDIVLFLFSFLLGLGIGMVASSNQTIWQKNTPMEIQGRVVSIRTFSLYALSPLFVYLAIPVTENFSSKIFGFFEFHTPLSVTIFVLGLFTIFISFVNILLVKIWSSKYDL